LNGLRSGLLGAVVLCRSGVRAKFGVNMGLASYPSRGKGKLNFLRFLGV